MMLNSLVRSWGRHPPARLVSVSLQRFARGAKPLPKMTLTHLSNRALICVSGKDSKKLLQGISTNDMELLKEMQSAIYSGFLNVKGRLIADAIIVRPKIATSEGVLGYKQNEYWLDIHQDFKSKLLNHIGKYTWKKSVQLSEIDSSETQIYAIYNHEMFQSTEQDSMCGKFTKLGDYSNSQIGNYVNHTFFDPRRVGLGIRMIGCKDTFSKNLFEEADLDFYEDYLIANGLGQGSQLTEKIPFQYNLDLLKGISFTKGCYIGQELISRAYHTGIVRKRIFPFILQDDSKTLEVDAQLIGKSGKTLGKVVQSKNNLGLALIDYLQITQQEDLQFTQPTAGKLSVPFQSELSNYLIHIKQKQQSLEKFNDI